MANDYLKEEIKIPFQPSTIETIDASMLNYIKGLDLFTKTNQGFKRVPVVWVTPERAFQSKIGTELRDSQGALIYPMISVERSGMVKDLGKKGSIYGNIPPVDDEQGGSIPVARTINHVKTKNFANKDAMLKHGQINFKTSNPNEKVVYQTMSIPLPVYIDVTYKITLRTEYQEQMNDLVTPFITRPGGINYVILKQDGHRFEAFVQQDFTQKNNLTNYADEERKYESEVTIKVLGYLIGDGKNQEKPFFAVRENAVEVKIPRERIVFGDTLEHENGNFRDAQGPWLPGLPITTRVVEVPGGPSFASTGGGSNRATAGSTFVTTNTFNTILNDVFSIREEPLNTVTNTAGAGSGATVFKTTYTILENTETVFVNGLLKTPGVHYRLNNNKTIEMIGQFGSVENGGTPLKSAAEKGGTKGDVLIISYIVG